MQASFGEKQETSGYRAKNRRSRSHPDRAEKRGVIPEVTGEEFQHIPFSRPEIIGKSYQVELVKKHVEIPH